MLTKPLNKKVVDKFWMMMKDQMERDFEMNEKENHLVLRGHVEQRSECRSVACMSMSSWLYGKSGRFVPTRPCDQGTFLDGMPVGTDREMITHPRDTSRVSSSF